MNHSLAISAALSDVYTSLTRTVRRQRPAPESLAGGQGQTLGHPGTAAIVIVTVTGDTGRPAGADAVALLRRRCVREVELRAAQGGDRPSSTPLRCSTLWNGV
jgi:hypothetical protein